MPRSANRHPLPELLISVDKLVELRELLMAAGHSRAKVAGCIEFVIGRTQGDDRTNDASRAEYRRMLSELLEVGPNGEPPIILVTPAAA